MNKNILFPALLVFFAGTVFTSCETAAKKVENAQTRVWEADNEAALARMELNKSIQDTLSRYEKSQKEFAAEISHSEELIAELKAQRADQKKENLARYEEELARLEQKNINLKKNLAK